MITDSLGRLEITADEERELIRQAQERVTVVGITIPTASAERAQEKLIAAYAGAINRAAKVPGMDWDDLEADLIETFLRAVAEYDFQSNNRLNYEIKLRFRATVGKAQAQREAFSIPTRTRALFYQIFYKEADGQWSKALDIAEKHPFMSRANFVSIATALHSVESLGDSETTASVWGQEPPRSNIEITDFVDWLRGSLNVRQRLVVDLHYGFSGEADKLREQHGFSYDESLSMPQIAAVLNVQRQTSWRLHNAAIQKMRDQIGIE